MEKKPYLIEMEAKLKFADASEKYKSDEIVGVVVRCFAKPEDGILKDCTEIYFETYADAYGKIERESVKGATRTEISAAFDEMINTICAARGLNCDKYMVLSRNTVKD